MAISSSLLSTTTTTSSSSATAVAVGTKDHTHQRIVRNHSRRQDRGKDEHQQQKKKRRKKKKQAAAATPQPPPLPLPTKPPSSWSQFKSLLTCRSLAPTQVHDPSSVVSGAGAGGSGSRYSKLSSSCSSLCTLKDVVVHSNTRVVHRDNSPPDTGSSNGSVQLLGPEARLLTSRSSATARSASRSTSGGGHHGSSRGMPPLRKLSGCYECRAISDPIRYPAPRTICACPECGDVFTKPESLELHQVVRHAVSELGPEDSGRNIVEIIFKSSWIKPREITGIDSNHPTLCKIDRILKVHNTQRTVSRFEEYRETVKSRAAMMLLHNSSSSSTANAAATKTGKKNPRCAADGNELLRFHCASVSCSLGARGSTTLCTGSSSGSCAVCSIIRHGFARPHLEQAKGGVRTTASSGRAHDCCTGLLPLTAAEGGNGTRRAMLVCRVIAGRVKRAADDFAGADDDLPGASGYDSVAGGSGAGRQACFGSGDAGGKAGAAGGGYGNLEELFVANPRAILPCFVVIYRTIC